MQSHVQIVSCSKAKELGMVRYFTGRMCSRGHFSERLTSNRKCVMCAKEWRQENRDYVAEYMKDWSLKNPTRGPRDRDRDRIISAAWRKRNPDWMADWRDSNSEKIRSQKRESHNRRYNQDDEFRLSFLMRAMLRKVSSKAKVSPSERTRSALGYSSQDLKEDIESKFLDGMQWDNAGDWHIDHLYPVSRYFSEGVRDPRFINRLDNLAPMWASDNLDKGAMTLREWLDKKGPDSREMALYGRFL